MWEKELAAAINAGELAKRIVLQVYKSPFHVTYKKDKSPVTEADKKSDAVIRKYLHEKFPTHAFLTEESVDDPSRFKNDYVWVIDPLDGTCDFVDKNDEFTINIALVYKHKVVVGVVVVPVTNEIYYASDHGGAFYSINGTVREIHVNRKQKDLKIMISRSHHGKPEEAMIKKYGKLIKTRQEVGAAIKACIIAKGQAELSLRLDDGTKEWDTAAAQIIVKEADGLFVLPNTHQWMTYNRKDVVNRDGYIIANRRSNILK
ncbi:MAG: 3'(2'),5'-bisphosphate nucleotidase CysQ [Bacilli bacterium]|nr:3'(2'),5'-bisphosphate nucleotidase CysQ [Bacilli bacterium]